MSNFEIFLIVMACAIPFIALLTLVPKIKLKKKEKKVAKPTKQLVDLKQEEKPIELVVEEKPKEIQQQVISNEISTGDFKNYLERKKQDVSKPKRVELPSDFKDISMPYMPRRRARQSEKPQNVAEEIKSLSPELKAMLIAGVLDKRNYD